MTALQQKRKEARRRRQIADFRARNAYRIGQRVRNAGDLRVGEEWDTPDGFRVRQVTAVENRFEKGHYYGEVEVVGFAEVKS